MMRYPKATVCILNLVKRKELVIVIVKNRGYY